MSLQEIFPGINFSAYNIVIMLNGVAVSTELTETTWLRNTRDAQFTGKSVLYGFFYTFSNLRTKNSLVNSMEPDLL